VHRLDLALRDVAAVAQTPDNGRSRQVGCHVGSTTLTAEAGRVNQGQPLNGSDAMTGAPLESARPETQTGTSTEMW
jgi:hypothetical protein